MTELHLETKLQRVLIVSITPYFLEKRNVWFEENLQNIVDAQKTQPFFEEHTIFLQKEQVIPLSAVLRKLDSMGYEKTLNVQEIGEFAHRGGTVEVFPINSSSAVRIDFLGNTIDSIELLPHVTYIRAVQNKDATEQQAQIERNAKELLLKRLKSQKLYADLRGLKAGDYMVHSDHGVGRFAGFAYLVSGILYPEEKIKDTKNKIQSTKYYVLEYAAGDKLYIPTGLERKLSRYVGFQNPKVSRMSSPAWFTTKRKVKEAVEKLAKELLELYAQKEVSRRPPYDPPGEISKAVESSFPYRETPDQLATLQAIEKDLRQQDPMDRIACGDVGFGKTEIALRTMVRAAEQGYQSALLAPTTILAYQHFQTFTARVLSLPLRVAMLSRIQSKKQQANILAQIKTGGIDIVIGTHRILSADVAFKNLGLLVIDDEQRFGVKQKEKLRTIGASLDVLSLSATPIPRTLYMALSSLKKLSIIQTAPVGRTQVETFVAKWNEKLIKEAVQTELVRKGQVYYLNNRIRNIALAKNRLQKLVPNATIAVAHGRMNETSLIKIMDDFKKKKYDVLVATTIIENGLDLPNVNTLIVQDAAKLGLAQAYQLRGRVGRSHTKARAYFFYGSKLQENAMKRLHFLQATQGVGAGYRIAMHDLELRGAGNILGKEQSGSINAVGLNLYCQILSEAVEKVRIVKRAL